MDYAISLNTPLDDETKEHIANALWMPTFEPEKIEEAGGGEASRYQEQRAVIWHAYERVP